MGRVRAIADAGGYRQPTGQSGSLLLVDAAQLAPSTIIDVAATRVDYLAFSFHKVLAPFGVGVLYALASRCWSARSRSCTAATWSPRAG